MHRQHTHVHAPSCAILLLLCCYAATHATAATALLPGLIPLRLLLLAAVYLGKSVVMRSKKYPKMSCLSHLLSLIAGPNA